MEPSVSWQVHWAAFQVREMGGSRCPPGAGSGKAGSVSQPMLQGLRTSLQPPEARVAKGCLETQLDRGLPQWWPHQAGRQRLPINRKIQVSKGPSGSLATGAEVGQCPHWAVLRAARNCLLPLLLYRRRGLAQSWAGPGSGSPPLLTAEVSIPVLHLDKLRSERSLGGHTTSKC